MPENVNIRKCIPILKSSMHHLSLLLTTRFVNKFSSSGTDLLFSHDESLRISRSKSTP